ncbi:MAG: carboxypeptidase regulatory-like domain-containing protein [Thermoplasmatota archaeon]
MKAGLVLAILLSGCAATPLTPAGIPVDDAGRALPTLHGIVVDAAIRPLAGAVVRLLGTDVNATTDAEGRYEIHRPTGKAEDVLVAAFMDGFIPLTHQVQVSGHRSASLDFVLDADPFVVPHVEILQFRGSLGCRLAATGGGQFQSLTCDPPDLNAPRDAPKPWIWYVNPTPGFAGAVIELDWEAESPSTQVLRARLDGPVLGGLESPVVAQAIGESPLRLEVPEGAARAFPRWSAVRLVVELEPVEAGDPAAAFTQGQRFDAYATVFYVDPAPPGYTLD